MGRENLLRPQIWLRSDFAKWMLMLGISAVLVWMGPKWIFDDAYMFLRYTHNILVHGTCGWNSGEHSYGCTSLGYLASNVLVAGIGLSERLGSERTLLFQSLGYLIAFLMLCMRLPKLALNRDSGRIGPWLGLLLAVMSAYGLRNQANGMDTLMAVFANGLVVAAAFHWRNRRSRAALLLLCIAGYFAFCVRPDSLFYFVLLPPLLLWAHRARLLDFVIWTLQASALLGIHLLATYLYFGTLLPIPFFVKAAGFFDAYVGIGAWNSQAHFSQFLWQFALLFVVLFRGFGKVPLRNLLPFLLPFLLTNLYLMGKIQIMGYHGRYFAPSLPMLIALVLVVVEGGALRTSAFGWARWRPWLASAAIFLLANWGISEYGDWNFGKKQANAETQAQAYHLKLENQQMLQGPKGYESMSAMSRLVKEVSGPDFVLAGSEHGLVSAENPETKIICLAGLHNNDLLRHQNADDHVLSQSLEKHRPDLIWLPHYDYVGLCHQVLSSSFFCNNYDYYPGLYSFGIAIRRDSPYQSNILACAGADYGTNQLCPATVLSSAHWPCP